MTDQHRRWRLATLLAQDLARRGLPPVTLPEKPAAPAPAASPDLPPLPIPPRHPAAELPARWREPEPDDGVGPWLTEQRRQMDARFGLIEVVAEARVREPHGDDEPADMRPHRERPEPGFEPCA
jgi:hypothetical protein